METMSRAQAGRQLGETLKGRLHGVPAVVALSAGGASVALEVARVLEAPLDFLAVVRLEVPGRPHSGFGAVVHGEVSLDRDRIRALDLPADYVQSLVGLARREAERLTNIWRGPARAVALREQNVVLVDDGLSHPETVLAAARAIRAAGARLIIYAAPAGVPRLAAVFASCCDDCLLLRGEEPVTSVLRDPDFIQTTPSDVGAMVRRSRATPGLIASR